VSRRLVFRLIGLALLAGFAALAVLPARWAMVVLPQSWPLAIVDASGTLWSGSATIAVGAPSYRRTLPDPLRWQLSFAPGPRLRVTHPWLGGPLILTPGWTGVGVSGQTLKLPASALGALDARIAAIGPGGELSFKWPASVIGSGSQPAGTVLLDAQWHNAVSSLTPVRPLGDYTLILKQGAQKNRVDLVLDTRQGPLMLNGVGTLDGKASRFDGTAQVDPAASKSIHAALHDVLAALGPQRNNQTILHFR